MASLGKARNVSTPSPVHAATSAPYGCFQGERPVLVALLPYVRTSYLRTYLVPVWFWTRRRGSTGSRVLPEPRLLARAVGYRWPSRTSSGRALRPLDWPVGSMPVQARQACRSLARSFRQAS